MIYYVIKKLKKDMGPPSEGFHPLNPRYEGKPSCSLELAGYNSH